MSPSTFLEQLPRCERGKNILSKVLTKNNSPPRFRKRDVLELDGTIILG